MNFFVVVGNVTSGGKKRRTTKQQSAFTLYREFDVVFDCGTPDRSALIRMTNEDTWDVLVGFSDSRYALWGTRVDFLAKQDKENC